MSEVTFFGKQLKLDKEEDGIVLCTRVFVLEPQVVFSIAVNVVKAIEEAEDLETLILSGNTCGVGACKAIGTALSTKATFKVPFCTHCIRIIIPCHSESNVERHIYWQTGR